MELTAAEAFCSASFAAFYVLLCRLTSCCLLLAYRYKLHAERNVL